MKKIFLFVILLYFTSGNSQTPESDEENMEQFLLHGKLIAKEGQSEQLADILLQASELVATAKGCIVYVVSRNPGEPQAVYVTEIWESKEDHANSLHVEGVKELITKAMPLLDQQPRSGHQLEVLGGAGI